MSKRCPGIGIAVDRRFVVASHAQCPECHEQAPVIQITGAHDMAFAHHYVPVVFDSPPVDEFEVEKATFVFRGDPERIRQMLREVSEAALLDGALEALRSPP